MSNPKPVLNMDGLRYRLIPYEVDERVACPFCGGSVRGHKWIGTETCSLYPPMAYRCAERRSETGRIQCEDPRCELCWGP